MGEKRPGESMTLLTIFEAAKYLRLTKRTLYQRVDIPRVRYGHRVMFVKEDLESWVRSLCEGGVVKNLDEQGRLPKPVDDRPSKVYHRNPLFVLSRHKGPR
jgi:excisionase family DNA binding protein